MLFQKDPSLDYGESPRAGLGSTGLSGSVHSLWKEVARFLTSDCKAPARLDPENVSLFPAFLPPWGKTIFLRASLPFQHSPSEPGQSEGQWVLAEETPHVCPPTGRETGELSLLREDWFSTSAFCVTSSGGCSKWLLLCLFRTSHGSV